MFTSYNYDLQFCFNALGFVDVLPSTRCTGAVVHYRTLQIYGFPTRNYVGFLFVRNVKLLKSKVHYILNYFLV